MSRHKGHGPGSGSHLPALWTGRTPARSADSWHCHEVMLWHSLHVMKTPPQCLSHGGMYGPGCVLAPWGKFPIADEAEAEGDSGTVSTFPCKVGCEVELEAWPVVAGLGGCSARWLTPTMTVAPASSFLPTPPTAHPTLTAHPPSPRDGSKRQTRPLPILVAARCGALWSGRRGHGPKPASQPSGEVVGLCLLCRQRSVSKGIIDSLFVERRLAQ